MDKLRILGKLAEHCDKTEDSFALFFGYLVTLEKYGYPEIVPEISDEGSFVELLNYIEEDHEEIIKNINEILGGK